LGRTAKSSRLGLRLRSFASLRMTGACVGSWVACVRRSSHRVARELRSSRHPSTAQSDAFAGAKTKEKESACFGRDDNAVIVALSWVVLNLNPSIWEAIAGTGCDGSDSVVVLISWKARRSSTVWGKSTARRTSIGRRRSSIRGGRSCCRGRDGGCRPGVRGCREWEWWDGN
jgi:hypothetical protein